MTTAARAGRPRCAEPTERGRAGVGGLARRWPASALWAGFFGPIQVLLAQQAEAVSPRPQGGRARAGDRRRAPRCRRSLNPVWGAFSDRTTLRFGRRLPWVLGGAVVGAVAMLLLVRGRLGAGDGARLGARPGVRSTRCSPRSPRPCPTRCRSRERGVVGGWLAIAQTARRRRRRRASRRRPAASRPATSPSPAVLVVLDAAVLPRLAATSRCPASCARRSRCGAFLRSFWVSPAPAPRLRVGLAHPVPDEPRQRARCILYLLYYLKDAVDLSRRRRRGRGVRAHRGLRRASPCVTAVVGGCWSDRLGRRKVFVIWSGRDRRRRRCCCSRSCTTLAGRATSARWSSAIGFGDLHRGRLRADHPGAARRRRPRQGPRRHQHRQRAAAGARPGVAAVVLGLGAGYPALYVLAALAAVLGSFLVRRIVGVP